MRPTAAPQSPLDGVTAADALTEKPVGSDGNTTGHAARRLSVVMASQPSGSQSGSLDAPMVLPLQDVRGGRSRRETPALPIAAAMADGSAGEADEPMHMPNWGLRRAG